MKFYEKYKGTIISNNKNNTIFISNTVAYNKNTYNKLNTNVNSIDYSPYIKSLLMSFYCIGKLQKYFYLNNQFFIQKKCEISNLINLYMNYFSKQNFLMCNNVIHNLNKE